MWEGLYTCVLPQNPHTPFQGEDWHNFGHILVLRLVFTGIATDYKSDIACQTHKEGVFESFRSAALIFFYTDVF